MRRSSTVWVGIVVGIVLLVVLGATLSGDDKGETVSAGEWAQNVCGAIGVWRGELETIVEEVRTPNASAPPVEEPQSETKQGRTGLVRKGLERSIQATDTLVEGIDNAGTPDTANGEQAAQQLSDWASSSKDELEQAQDSLDEEANTLEDAIRQLTTAAGALGTTLASGVKTFADVAASDPALAAALRDSSTCQELRKKEADV